MTVMFASPLEPEFADRVRALDAIDDVIYEPDLLPPIRYPNDHGGDPAFTLTAEQQARWNAHLARTDVLFGYPREASIELARALHDGPNVRFVQGTSAGMGAHIKRAGLPPEILERVRFASAAGVHAGMLAEFTFYGMLALRKDAARLSGIRAERRWDHYVMGELDGSAIGILGMGQIGAAVARRARAFGMEVVGFSRTGAPRDGYDRAYPTSHLRSVVSELDALVVTLPITDATKGIVSAEAIAAMRPSMILVNVGRGAVVDQAALLDALVRRRIAGAVLDVFDTEPLPPDHPYWDLPNVVFSPHTAAISVHENARIVDIFCDNLQRFALGKPLRNAVNLIEFY